MRAATLLPRHAALIKASAIDPFVAKARGYWSAARPKQLERHFGATQRRLVPALVIPIHGVRGEVVFHQIRPYEPRTVKGKGFKYETPSDAIGAQVSKETRETVEAVRELIGDDQSKRITNRQLVVLMKLDRSAVGRRVRKAIEQGYLVNVEDRPRKPTRLRLGDPLPGDQTILPSWDVIEMTEALRHEFPIAEETVATTMKADPDPVDPDPETETEVETRTDH